MFKVDRNLESNGDAHAADLGREVHPDEEERMEIDNEHGFDGVDRTQGGSPIDLYEYDDDYLENDRRSDAADGFSPAEDEDNNGNEDDNEDDDDDRSNKEDEEEMEMLDPRVLERLAELYEDEWLEDAQKLRKLF